MKNILTRAGLTLGLAASILVSNAVAQQQQPDAPADGGIQSERGREGRRGHHKRGGRGMDVESLAALNLTDAQKQQIESILERYQQSNRAKHEEMRQIFEQKRSGATLTPEQEARSQALRTEFHQSRESMRAEISAVLTPEQRTQLDQIKQEHKARREQFRQQRQQRRMQRDNRIDTI